MNRYSFTGKGNILIKAGASGAYGGKQFAAHEPIAYFTDVIVDVAFSNVDKVSRQGTANLAADSKAEASTIVVQNIKTSESLQSLLYKKQTNNTKDKTEVKSLISTGGFLYLPINTGDVVNPEIFIYDSNKGRITSFTLAADGIILGLTDGTYTVFYSVSKLANSTYSLETPTLPNMSLEITAIGNLNGTTGEVVLHIGSVKLLSRPQIDLTNDLPFVDTLEFAIFSNKDGLEINYYG